MLLAAAAVRVVVTNRPRSGRRAEDLPTLRAHAAESSASVSWFSQSHAASTSLQRNRTGRTVPGIRRPGFRPSREYGRVVAADSPRRSATSRAVTYPSPTELSGITTNLLDRP